MTLVIPAEHIVENQKLIGDAYIDLWEVYFNPTGFTYFKNDAQVRYLDKVYEGLAIKISGLDRNADEQESRPTLTIYNPEGVFSPFVARGELDKSRVVRRRVLREHLDSNVDIAQVRMWYVARVALLTRGMIALELRDISDGPNFIIPARTFVPPEFPSVSLR